MTLHALARMQQRGIPERVIDLLLAFGESEHDHRGGEILTFGRRGLRRVERFAGPSAAREAQKHRKVYAVVVSGGELATVGHRRRRVPRH